MLIRGKHLGNVAVTAQVKLIPYIASIGRVSDTISNIFKLISMDLKYRKSKTTR